MPAPVNTVGGSPYGQSGYSYSGRVQPGQGRPDQVGMPRYNNTAPRNTVLPPPRWSQGGTTPYTNQTPQYPGMQNPNQGTTGGGGLFGDLFGNMFGGGSSQITAGIGTNPAVGGGFVSQMNNGLINTSIQPTGIYSPQQTQQAMHQGVANAQQGANMPWLQSQMRRPGMSVNSPATQSRALPQFAGALAQGNEAQWAIPMEDMIANASHLLQGQTAREDEALGWGRLQSLMNTAQQRFGAQMISNLLSQFAG